MQKKIVNNLVSIWEQLKKVFRDNGKSYYNLVEDVDQPSIRLSLQLNSASIKNDTLNILIKVSEDNIKWNTTKEYTFHSFSTVSSLGKNKSQFVDSLFSEYTRSFPYMSILNTILTNQK